MRYPGIRSGDVEVAYEVVAASSSALPGGISVGGAGRGTLKITVCRDRDAWTRGVDRTLGRTFELSLQGTDVGDPLISISRDHNFVFVSTGSEVLSIPVDAQEPWNSAAMAGIKGFRELEGDRLLVWGAFGMACYGKGMLQLWSRDWKEEDAAISVYQRDGVVLVRFSEVHRSFFRLDDGEPIEVAAFNESASDENMAQGIHVAIPPLNDAQVVPLYNTLPKQTDSTFSGIIIGVALTIALCFGGCLVMMIGPYFSGSNSASSEVVIDVKNTGDVPLCYATGPGWADAYCIAPGHTGSFSTDQKEAHLFVRYGVDPPIEVTKPLSSLPKENYRLQLSLGKNLDSAGQKDRP